MINFSKPIVKPLVEVVNPIYRIEQVHAHLEALRLGEDEQAFTEAALDAVDVLKSWLSTWGPFIQAIATERAYLEEMYYRNGGIAKSVADNWTTASRKEKEFTS